MSEKPVSEDPWMRDILGEGPTVRIFHRAENATCPDVQTNYEKWQAATALFAEVVKRYAVAQSLVMTDFRPPGLIDEIELLHQRWKEITGMDAEHPKDEEVK
jgi:hypothetical protein